MENENDFRIRNASLSGSLENNVADFALSVKDSVKKEIHALHGFDIRRVKHKQRFVGAVFLQQLAIIGRLDNQAV